MLRCLLCNGAAESPALCTPCREDIERLRLSAPCAQCGLPREIKAMELCSQCLKTPPPVERLFVHYRYEPPLDALVLRYKYGGQWQLSSMLAGLMPAPPPVDMVLPVPLHAAREQWRGFNQARELAKCVGLQPREGVLTRVKDTAPQAELTSAAERRKNIQGAFEADEAVRGASVLLVDDVVTSGATLWEAAHTLRAAGAASVMALLLARTVL